jgi:glycosyltransferase involved in cell wall biosynthesis
VVTSGAGGMEEVAGDAAVIVTNGTPEDYARRIDELWADSDRLKSLQTKGVERAAGFNWQQTASLTADVYRGVLD